MSIFVCTAILKSKRTQRYLQLDVIVEKVQTEKQYPRPDARNMSWCVEIVRILVSHHENSFRITDMHGLLVITDVQPIKFI